VAGNKLLQLTVIMHVSPCCCSSCHGYKLGCCGLFGCYGNGAGCYDAISVAMVIFLVTMSINPAAMVTAVFEVTID
jgi:hypothetical protein